MLAKKDQSPPEALMARYQRAKSRRGAWESHWRECYEFAMPQRDGALSSSVPGEKKTDRLFDSTAPDAVDQLAASLMAELTPPWARWFELVPGPEVPAEERDSLAGPLEEAASAIQTHFDHSNFAVEIHQCYLDLVTVGTACLKFEEAPLGESSAFRFGAVPLGEAVLEEGATGLLDVTFRRTEFTEEALRHRFPDAELVMDQAVGETDAGDKKFAVLESVVPDPDKGYLHRIHLLEGDGVEEAGSALRNGVFPSSPFINFRWMKAPGEIYGRSPVMKALPDIKTANKVVELVLKNATISVTGIWQADDDGVLNPATVKLLPGTIIPKAVGSSGLTPLSAPGNFDVSSLVLDDMRQRIRHALMGDRLAQVDAPRMTATEVLERSTEMARQLSAVFGRMQAELLVPLAERAVSILRRRGEIPDITLDGQEVALEIVSPIALHQRRANAKSAVTWFETLALFGPEAAQVVDPQKAARWLAKSFRVPQSILRDPSAVAEQQAQAAAPGGGAGGATPAGLDALLSGGAAGAAGADGSAGSNPLSALAGMIGSGMPLQAGNTGGGNV